MSRKQFITTQWDCPLRKVWSRSDVGRGGVNNTWTVFDDLPPDIPVTKEEIDIFEAFLGDILDDLVRASR